MAKKRPAEFFTDWHYEAHLKGLAREIEGRKQRLAWFKGMDEENPDRALGIKQTQMELEAAQEQLDHYTGGAKTASKRPAASGAKTR